MGGNVGATCARLILSAGLLAGFAGSTAAQTLLQTSTEVRMQLDFRVPEAALAEFLPEGWEPNIATQGPAKDCNIRVIFIDQIGISDAENQVAGPGMARLVYLAVPVRQTGTDTTGQMIIGGITTHPDEVPGPFGNYLAASAHSMERSYTAGPDGVTGTESWSFEAESGEHLAFSATYDLAAVARRVGETRFYSALDPANYQIFKIDQGLDIAWNATTGADRVAEYEWSAGGGSYAPLFDGTEEILSIDVITWYTRGVYAP